MIIKTQPTYVNKGGQGFSFRSLVDLIGQQLTNTTAVAAANMVDELEWMI